MVLLLVQALDSKDISSASRWYIRLPRKFTYLIDKCRHNLESREFDSELANTFGAGYQIEE